MRKISVLLVCLGIMLAGLTSVHAQSNQPLALVMAADGPIGPPMLEYIKRGVQTAEQRNAEVLIIQLNTPGGDLLTMFSIIKQIRASTVPVVVYVAPKNAIAGSAGALITMSGHVSAMAPETTIGASTPINGSGDNLPSDERTKQINASETAIEPFVSPRGDKAVALANSMIAEAKAATANEALEAKLIDFIANDTNDLLQKLDGFTVQVNNKPHVFHTAKAQTEPLPMSFIEQLLLFLTNPNIVFSLLSLGITAIVIEISSPGGWVAGFTGAVCILLATYGLGILPVNWLGILFFILAFILFILDIKAPTHGALTTAGVASFITGALVLFNSPGTPQFQQVSVPLVVTMGLVLGLSFFGMLMFALRAMRNPISMGVQTMIGKTGTAKTWDEAGGQVQLAAELWSADPASETEKISKGDKVEVVEVQGLHLKVRKIK